MEACWSKIGVWTKGERSCPELERVIHCANCPVFSEAGRQLLETPAPEGYLAQWSEFFSQEQDEKERNTQSIILFRLGDEWLSLPALLLDEVVPIRSVHRVPHRSSPILKGLVNIRGELQICVSLGCLLNITKGEVSGASNIKNIYERMMVVNLDGGRYVFPVSEIKGVHRYHTDALQSAPATAMNCSVHYLKGMLTIDKHLVGLIDHELLFSALDRGIL